MIDIEGAIAQIKNKDNLETYDPSTDSLEAIVDNLLQNATYGLAAIRAALDGVAAGAFYSTHGPKNVEIGNYVDFGVTLVDPAGNIITAGEITPGTYTVHRVRGAVDTEIVGSTGSSETAGRVYMTYDFPGVNWAVGDIFYVTFSGIKITVDATETEYPDIFIWGRVVREADISAKIGANTDLPGTTTVFARLRQIVDDYLADASHGLAALKTLIDSVEAKLDDPAHGLVSIKSEIQALEAKLDDPASGLGNIKAEIEAIETKLDAPVSGLSSIKSEIETIESKLDSPTHGLANIKSEIGAIEAKLDDPTNGLASIKGEIQAIEAKLDDATHGLAAIKTEIEAIEAKLDHATHGLAAIKAEIESIEAKLDDPTNGLASIKSEVQAIEAKLDSPTYGLPSLENKLDKLAGLTPASGSVTANWYSGTGTSGESGADLVTIGANDTKYKVLSLIVDIANIKSGVTVHVKLFMQVNGTERKVYDEPFVKDADPDGLWVVNGVVGIHEALRVEFHSEDSSDNGKSIGYDYMLEAM
jgi:predicted  nucleic acid-binding Zn-ribbon protein